MIFLLILGTILFFCAGLFIVAMSGEQAASWLLLAVLCILSGTTLYWAALSTSPPPDIAKARQRVDAACAPYQVRNLHREGSSFIFNCANDPKLRVVNAR